MSPSLVTTGGVYLGGAARERAERTQAELERHLATDPNGRCLTCGHAEPCPGRAEAYREFARLGVLPQRRPGGRPWPGTSSTSRTANGQLRREDWCWFGQVQD